MYARNVFEICMRDKATDRECERRVWSGVPREKESSKREEDGAIGVGNSEQWSGVVVGAVTLWQGGCVSCGV